MLAAYIMHALGNIAESENTTIAFANNTLLKFSANIKFLAKLALLTFILTYKLQFVDNLAFLLPCLIRILL